MKLIRDFLAPTPEHIKKWQLVLGFIAAICTSLAAADTEIPKWISYTGAISSATVAFLAQFVTKKEA